MLNDRFRGIGWAFLNFSYGPELQVRAVKKRPPHGGPMAAVPRTAVVRASACGGAQRLIGGSQREYDCRRPRAAIAAQPALNAKPRSAEDRVQ